VTRTPPCTLSGSPSLSITVNGTVVLRRTGASAARAHAHVEATQHFSGTSLKDMLALPANSRVAVLCDTPHSEMAGDAHGVITVEKCW
jgi:hypothetical protein